METRPPGALFLLTASLTLSSLTLLSSAVATAAPPAAPRAGREAARGGLAGGPAAWLEEVEPLITARERAAFLELAGDDERQAFVRRFWQVRDPYHSTQRNELEDRWASRLPEARRRWGSLRDDRARVFLLQGEPSARLESACGAAGAFEAWIFDAGFQAKYRLAFLFAIPEGGEAKLWLPDGQVAGPPDDAATACTGGAQLAQEARWMRLIGADNYRAVVERALAGPRPEPADWVATFVPFTTAVPEGAPALEAGLEVEFPGQVEGKTVLRAFLILPPEVEATAEERELLLNGEVLRGSAALDAFRYRFRIAPDAAGGGPVPLAFERYLPPGPCRLVVRLEDLAAHSFFHDERDLEVPGPGHSGPMPLDLEPPPAQVAAATPEAAAWALAPRALGATVASAAPTSPELARFYEEATASLAAREPAVQAVAPRAACRSGCGASSE